MKLNELLTSILATIGVEEAQEETQRPKEVNDVNINTREKRLLSLPEACMVGVARCTVKQGVYVPWRTLKGYIPYEYCRANTESKNVSSCLKQQVRNGNLLEAGDPRDRRFALTAKGLARADKAVDRYELLIEPEEDEQDEPEPVQSAPEPEQKPENDDFSDVGNVADMVINLARQVNNLQREIKSLRQGDTSEDKPEAKADKGKLDVGEFAKLASEYLAKNGEGNKRTGQFVWWLACKGKIAKDAEARKPVKKWVNTHLSEIGLAKNDDHKLVSA